MTPAPDVTAIVSTYASAFFLPGCLEDLLGQTLAARGRLEIIVVDSGSPQNEGDIVRAYQARTPRLRYVRTPRETIYAAWNRAAALAEGRYLTNANTDDRHHPGALERLAAVLDQDPSLAAVYAQQLVTDVPNETFLQNTAREHFALPRFSIDGLLERDIVGPQPMWRRSLHDVWGGFDERFRVAGDWEFWLRIAQGERVAQVPEFLGLYYRNPGGLELSSVDTRPESVAIAQQYRQRLIEGEFRSLSQPQSWGRRPLAPVPPPSLAVREAGALVGRGDLGAACAHLVATITSAPAPDVFMALASAALWLGSAEHGLRVLQQGLSLFPGDTALTLRSAWMLVYLGRLTEARAAVTTAEARAPRAAADLLAEIDARTVTR